MFARISEKTDEIELAGSAKELDLLSRQLLTNNNKVNLEYDDVNPFPYIKNLETIQIKHFSNQKVKISVEDNSLLIEGSSEYLRLLSENIEASKDVLKNYHIHTEYFDGHFYLSKASKPLIVSFQ